MRRNSNSISTDGKCNNAQNKAAELQKEYA